MAWFNKSKASESAPPRLRNDIYIRCKSCKAHIFKEDYFNNSNVCPKCDYHGKVTAYERIGITLDTGTFREINETITPSDPLSFVDGKGAYADKVEKARRDTGLNEAVVTGTGKIDDRSVVVAVMDFRFVGGSLS